MHETPAELEDLQELIDRNSARMNPHMASIVAPERRLNARQVVVYVQGVKHVAFAHDQRRGEPRVAPSTASSSTAASTSAPAAAPPASSTCAATRKSVTHFQGDDVAIIVHGRVEVFEQEHREIASLESIYVEVYGSSPFSWGESVVIIRVEPDEIFTYAPTRSSSPRADHASAFA